MKSPTLKTAHPGSSTASKAYRYVSKRLSLGVRIAKPVALAILFRFAI
jgi:hypothetical protein